MSAARFDAVVPLPAMHVGVRVQDGRVAELCYLPFSVPLRAPANRLAARAARQIERYGRDPDARFDLPLAEVGSAFQRAVWEAIRAIPRGATLTYGQVARRLGTGPRAVGQACGANWFPLVIPCHRVVASGGLGGFAHHGAGFHLEIKRWLLEHERI
jgi:methylated-DNA-[protein]-cysteine S-methyltransferase